LKGVSAWICKTREDQAVAVDPLQMLLDLLGTEALKVRDWTDLFGGGSLYSTGSTNLGARINLSHRALP